MQHNICGVDIICLIVYFYKRNEVQIMRTVGTVSRGVRCPVVKEGDDLIRIVTEAIADMGKEEHITFHEKDIVAVTEAVVARTQGNYASTDDIAKDCRTKFGCDTIAVTFPILSRNRIAICLKGIAKAFKKVYILMSYPSDEVGNHLFDDDLQIGRASCRERV